MVIVDRLTKVAHFIPVKTTYKGTQLEELYMTQIVCLHGLPKKIISDRGSQFTSRFWKSLHESMDTKLNISSAYHPQIDGQTKRINKVLEDMLRAWALKHGGSWDKSLPYCHTRFWKANQMRTMYVPRSETHVHNGYIIGHHHTLLKVNSGKGTLLHQDVQDIHSVIT
jgi:transposase InsO family protein